MISFKQFLYESSRRKNSIDIDDETVRSYLRKEREVSLSERYEITVSNVLQKMFQNSKLPFTSKWNQDVNESEILDETSNKESDVLILDGDGNTVSTVEVKQSTRSQLFNVSIKKETFYPDNLDFENQKILSIIGNAFPEFLDELNNPEQKFNRWFWKKFLPKKIYSVRNNRNKIFQNLKNIAVYWYKENKTLDLPSIELDDIAERFRTHYEKKHTDYVVIGEKMFSFDRDVLNLGVPTLPGDLPARCTLRFKHAPKNGDYSRIISRINFAKDS